MASINIRGEWKKALELLECAVAEWESLAEERQKLDAGELVTIELNLEALQQFVEANFGDNNCLVDFYLLYERISVQIHLASMKIKFP